MSSIVDYAKDWALNQAATYLRAGIEAGGTAAGNAVIGVGNAIEQGGKTFAEGTVAGSIKGVGNYVNSYGDGIKASTAVVGPNARKTGVKAQTGDSNKRKPVKALPATGGLKAGALTKTSAVTQMTVARGKVTSARQMQKSLPSGKIRISPESRAAVSAGGSKTVPPRVGSKPGSKMTETGKVRISPESRPKPVVKV
ncbi:hypothetical protein K470DRAFT_268597 [Piedraia hortae CBS 480.64]|uniref:Uncharacterized protein n=1 Tax=Piedraia hortae CBS 480.64 TaxID=1314780 RepID=A0A6A7C8T8_9PEZI|nr:hypothetical protein K470DRAFT_268597 [Piedraia hortae CBS 480.64]